MDIRMLQRFDLKDLCYFVSLAEELHFGRAAARLGTHQSPMSKAIARLEYQLHLKLFERNRRRTALTEAGAAFLPNVRVFLSSAESMYKEMTAYASGRKGHVRVGVTNGLSVNRIVKFLNGSAEQDPDIEFVLEPRTMTELIRDLRCNRLDVGIAASLALDPLGTDWELQSIALHQDPVALMLPPSHLLAEQPVVRSLEAATGPYLVVAHDEAEAQDIRTLIMPQSAATEAIRFVATQELLKAAVLTGRGVGILGSEQAATADGLVLRPLGLARARLTTHLVMRREKVSPAALRFSERAKRLA